VGAVSKIVSGGQTGVDRAALDVALALGLDCGGWCPLGRRAEDGPIPGRYPLRQCESPEYAERTRLNVRDSDATLVVCTGQPMGGSALTKRLAGELGRPVLVIDPDAADTRSRFGEWIGAGVAVLNVAGPRESTEPGIYGRARAFLIGVLG
jgi:hypothetical protein